MSIRTEHADASRVAVQAARTTTDTVLQFSQDDIRYQVHGTTRELVYLLRAADASLAAANAQVDEPGNRATVVVNQTPATTLGARDLRLIRHALRDYAHWLLTPEDTAEVTAEQRADSTRAGQLADLLDPDAP